MSVRLTVRGVVFSALFAALLSASSFLNLTFGFSPVPISLENLIVMLAGILLGARYAFFSMFLVVFLALVGLPLFHGLGGLGLIFGYTGGYIWMYPFSALFIGAVASRVPVRGWYAWMVLPVTAFVCGSLLTYVTGVPWLAHVYHLPLHKALLYGFYPYLPGDAVKAVIATLIAVPVRRVYPVARLVGGLAAQVVPLSE